ncbi:MAG: nucleoid-associated protein [Deltaproteobacteria bacterium]|nr:nucleoid-associated protein [Deltaproteobacteria bacterium]
MSFENLTISRIVIHEIYKRTDERAIIKPSYGTGLVKLDHEALDALCDRINSAMGSAARSMELDIIYADVSSSVAIAKSLVDADESLFVEKSKAVADKLTASQARRDLPGGVLVVFSGTAGHPSKRIIGIIKAETHTGFTRRISSGGAISLQFLKNLLLTPQTKLYKIGVFWEQDPHITDPLPAGWRAFIYDDQINTSNKLTAAQYFYESFLGCGFPETSARRTREFHDYTKEFIHKLDWPEGQKTDLHNALVTYLKVDQSATVQVSHFAQTYLRDAQIRDEYAQFMTGKEFPLCAISKDLSDVMPALKYRKVTFRHDIKLIAPAEKFENFVRMREIDGEVDDHGQAPRWTEVIIRDSIRTQE